jgi:exodeoxyribonuclease V alpha subunit
MVAVTTLPTRPPGTVLEAVLERLTYVNEETGGHCYLPQPELVADAVKILGVPTDLIGACLDALVAEEGVVREALPGDDGPITAVYLVPLHRAETALAGSLIRLVRERADRMPHFRDVDWAKALGWLHTRTGNTLAPEKEQAVRLALTSKVAVLTGGPGCGKASPSGPSSPSPRRRKPRSPWPRRPAARRNVSPN